MCVLCCLKWFGMKEESPTLPLSVPAPPLPLSTSAVCFAPTKSSLEPSTWLLHFTSYMLHPNFQFTISLRLSIPFLDSSNVYSLPPSSTTLSINFFLSFSLPYHVFLRHQQLCSLLRGPWAVVRTPRRVGAALFASLPRRRSRNNNHHLRRKETAVHLHLCFSGVKVCNLPGPHGK